jgi:hypothetical protein
MLYHSANTSWNASVTFGPALPPFSQSFRVYIHIETNLTAIAPTEYANFNEDARMAHALVPSGEPLQELPEVLEDEDLVTTLPTWRWKDNSCSLDAALIIAVQVCVNIPLYVEKTRQMTIKSPLVCFEMVADQIDGWASQGRSSWESWEGAGTLTKFRDRIRAGLIHTHKLVINAKSSVSDCLHKLLHDRLTRPTVELKFTCHAKACRQKRDKGQNAGPQSMKKTISPDVFLFPAAWQNNISTQDIWERIVTLPHNAR